MLANLIEVLIVNLSLFQSQLVAQAYLCPITIMLHKHKIFV